MKFKEFVQLSDQALLTEMGIGILPDIGLPTVSKSALIRYINNKINPILVFLADGTRLFLPYDAFKRIKEEPTIGKTMTVVFQRREANKSKEPSQIHACHCH